MAEDWTRTEPGRAFGEYFAGRIKDMCGRSPEFRTSSVDFEWGTPHGLRCHVQLGPERQVWNVWLHWGYDFVDGDASPTRGFAYVDHFFLDRQFRWGKDRRHVRDPETLRLDLTRNGGFQLYDYPDPSYAGEAMRYLNQLLPPVGPAPELTDLPRDPDVATRCGFTAAAAVAARVTEWAGPELAPPPPTQTPLRFWKPAEPPRDTPKGRG